MSIPSIVYKAHATGNDFVVYLDEDGTHEPTADEVRFLCDRHFGIGGDGLIRLAHPQAVSDVNERQIADCAAGDADWFMDYRNGGRLAGRDVRQRHTCDHLVRAAAGHRRPAGRQAIPSRTRAGVKILTSLGDVPGLGKDVFQVEMGAWKRGDVDGYEVTIPGTSGSARGTFVDMGNPHVVAVLEDAFASLPNVEDLDLVTKPVVAPEIPSDQNVEFVRIDEQSEGDDAGEATMRVNERGCGETLSCGTGLCATAITLRAKTGIDHWTITVRGGTLRVDVTDEDVKLTGSATIVGKIELL